MASKDMTYFIQDMHKATILSLLR